MATSVLSAPQFQDEKAAFAYVEARLWPNGPVCPFCGETERVGRLKGKTTRPGLCKCYACQKPFTVRMGTMFESSHLPLRYWLQVIHLMCASKKGISTRQIQRMLNCSMKTAWFLTHRIREAMNEGSAGPLGGEGITLEADETFTGPIKYEFQNGRGWVGLTGTGSKRKVVTLVERGGKARSVHVDRLTASNVRKVVLENADTRSHLMTDEAHFYPNIGKHFASHQSVVHSKGEYVRGDVTTNTVEGFFSIFKRGMKGVYQHCSEKHLQRYLYEFDFRYSNRVKLGVDDVERAERALLGVKGKRITYTTPDSAKTQA